MSPSSSTTVLLGSALLVAAAAATSYYSSKGGESSREITEIGDDDYITEEDVCKIFDRLFLEMQAVVAQLSQQIQQIQMTGQNIPEQQLRQILKGEFERQLLAKQQQVMDEFDVDEDCLQEATWEFLENGAEFPKAKRAVERFQKLWENISGESVVGKRPGMKHDPMLDATEILSAARVVEAAEVYFEAITDAMHDVVKAFKAEGKDLRHPAVAQDLHIEFSSVANDKGEDALKAMGVTQLQFQKSIETNASNPTVGRALAMLQMKQQQALMAMGVPH
jgi:hypothetical protein